MPKYQLKYFDAPGAAEHIRYIFAYANQEYEDVRLKHADWPKVKPTTPFGKVPVLTVDDKALTQSNTIARYLARTFGLTGKDDWEATRAEELVDTLKDVSENLYNMFFEEDAGKKEKLRQELRETHIPFYFGKFDKLVAENPAGYIVGSQLTWADLTFAAHLKVMEDANPDLLKPYPALKKLITKVNSIPSIKAWIDKRPANPMPIQL